jgi:molybdate transport system substrate-binding protein
MIPRILNTIVSLSLILACKPALANELVVSAAASLTTAFQEMKVPFEKDHPGTTLVFNFAASGPLLQQIQQGAPVDVFASADQETMDKANELIDATSRVNFADNTLVLIAPADGSPPLSDPKELVGDEFKLIAIGNPDSVPLGRYTKGVLTAAGLFDPLAPKFVMAESARQALDYVARGEVQGGFVYATDAVLRADKVRVAAQVADDKPISYPIAVLQTSANKDMAQKYIDFVMSEKGQAILAKFGFKKP